MRNLTINHAAVWVAIVLLHVLGFLWYGPLFGESWMKMVGLEMADMANGPGTGAWISNTVATIIPVYTMAWFFTEMKVESALKGALIGILIGFAFVHLSAMTHGLFAKYPYGLSWINGGLSMVSLGLTGAILGGWRKYTS